MEVIKYCYSVLYLLSCEVYKWLKISLQKITSGNCLPAKSESWLFPLCGPETTKQWVLIGFNSLASYAEPFWQDGRHTGKI